MERLKLKDGFKFKPAEEHIEDIQKIRIPHTSEFIENKLKYWTEINQNPVARIRYLRNNLSDALLSFERFDDLEGLYIAYNSELMEGNDGNLMYVERVLNGNGVIGCRTSFDDPTSEKDELERIRVGSIFPKSRIHALLIADKGRVLRKKLDDDLDSGSLYSIAYSKLENQ